MSMKCIYCKTEVSERWCQFNEGVVCLGCFEVALNIQQMDFLIERTRERIAKYNP